MLFLFPRRFPTGGNVSSRQRCTQFLVYCLFVVTLSACSGTTFVYNRLDWLLPWYVEDYAELDGDQERFLDERLTPFLSWHRQTELPCYIDLLDHIEASVQQDVSPQDVALIADALERAWLRTQDESLHWLLDLGEQLSDKQITEFLSELSDKQQEAEDKYLGRSDESFQADNYDTLYDIAKDYLGKLQQHQREQTSEVSKRLRRSDNMWLQERAAFHQRLSEVLQREEGWQQRTRRLIETRMSNAPDEYQAVFEHNAVVIHEWVASLINGRSDKQNEHLQKKLEKLRGQLETLIAQVETPSACTTALI